MSNNLNAVAFVQPAVPKYRIDFFSKLGQLKSISIYTAKVDFLGVQSELGLKDAHYQSTFIKIGQLYWHRDLPIRRILKNHSKIVINGNMRIINYMLLLVAARIMGKEVIWWGHLNTAGSYGVYSKIRKLFMRVASKILFYTDNEKDRFSSNKKIYALNNGLTLPDKVPAKLLTHFLNSGTTRLFFIGRLTQKCNILFALDALSTSKLPFEFHIVGDGPIMEECRRFQNDPRFIFYGAVFEENEIWNIATKCDLFLYPGAVGLSLIKGFGYGLPAVLHSNFTNHMPEFGAAIENKNALFFRENKKKSLIEAIYVYQTMCSYSKLQLHHEARQTVQRTFNTDDMVRRMIVCIDG